MTKRLPIVNVGGRQKELPSGDYLDDRCVDIGAAINGATEKTTPVDADMFGLMDSAASNVLKKFSWSSLKTAIKSYLASYFVTSEWTEVTGTSVTLEAGKKYRFNNSSLLTAALPTTIAVDKEIEIWAVGAGGFKTSQASGQQQRLGNKTTTSGTSGYLSNVDGTTVERYVRLTIHCIVADTTFAVDSNNSFKIV